MNESSDPRVLIFACDWCPGLGSDRAGQDRLSLPSCFRLVRVDCAAQVSGEWVIEAFSGGIDGIMVMGCHLDACRHQGANHRAHKKLETLRWLLSGLGIPPEKLCLSWGMGREALPFQEEVQKFVSTLKSLKTEKKGINSLQRGRAATQEITPSLPSPLEGEGEGGGENS
jgi:F420-non-reducing hydrogenase iron-sulfur subunit